MITIKFILPILIFLLICNPTVALAAQPYPNQLVKTETFTLTMPAIGTGVIYQTLVTSTNQMLMPLDNFVISSTSMVTVSASGTATGIATNVSSLWQYLYLFGSYIPLTTATVVAVALLTFLIYLIKIIISAIMYLKTIIPLLG